MIFIELEREWNYGENLIKYRDENSEEWYYMYIDIETMSHLLYNFGIISALRVPTRYCTMDNPWTGRNVIVKYCGAEVTMICNNNMRITYHSMATNY